jgi:hypothetical protein
MTNELSLNKWGSLRDDLPKFKDYHKEILKELKARKLDIQLLATDASPISHGETTSLCLAFRLWILFLVRFCIIHGDCRTVGNEDTTDHTIIEYSVFVDISQCSSVNA